MSLKEGVATIQFVPANRVRVAQVWKVVRDNGFTPRASSIRAVGVVEVRGDAVFLNVTGSDESFLVENIDLTRDRVAELRAMGAGRRVRADGELRADRDTAGESAARLRLRAFTAL